MNIHQSIFKPIAYLFLQCTIIAVLSTQLAYSRTPLAVGTTEEPGWVQNYSEHVFAQLTIIDAEELESIRGGFSFGGMDFNITADIRTTIDGHLALLSNLTLTNNGFVTKSIASPASANVPGFTLVSGSNASNTLRSVVPNGVKIKGLNGSSQGIVLNDAKGFTAALQTIRNGRFLSTVLNQSSGRTIRHQVDIDVTVRNFRQFQQAANATRLVTRFSTR